jgi:hypothetical protein
MIQNPNPGEPAKNSHKDANARENKYLFFKLRVFVSWWRKYFD